MTENKYYFLKLSPTFFDDVAVRIIEAQEDGDLIIYCYLKMLFESVPSGRIDNCEELPRFLKISRNKFEKVIRVLQYYQLVILDNEGAIIFPYVSKKTVYVSGEPTGRDRNSVEYKHWRTSVFVRDNFTCQECGRSGVELNAHHIKRWKLYPEERFNIENGITLCVDCHKAKHRRATNGN